MSNVKAAAGDTGDGREPGEQDLPLYLVERHIPGMGLTGVEALRAAEERACEEAATRGTPVRYLRSTFAPGESRCLCLFQAPNADVVQEVNEVAQIPYSRIIAVIDLATR